MSPASPSRTRGSTPVFVGVGALRISQVLANVEAAEQAGAAGVLLAPMTYQPLQGLTTAQRARAVEVVGELGLG